MTTWNLDTAHSEIAFKVKHLMISTVRGKFNAFSGSVVASDETFADAQISFSADVASIDTNSPDRDSHLKSPDFFDVAKFPTITFKSVSMKPDGKSKTTYT